MWWGLFKDFTSALTDVHLTLSDIDPYLIEKWVDSQNISSWVLAILKSKCIDILFYISCKCIVSGINWWINKMNH
jgi:hypothetical protein